MIGVVIVAHGQLALAFKEVTELILGPQENFMAVSVMANDKSDLARKNLRQAIAEVNQGEGVLILTDMFGGSPTNLSLSFLEESNIEVLTGVNLPMLIKLMSLRQEPVNFKSLKEKLCIYGREKIIAASELLNQRLIKQGSKT